MTDNEKIRDIINRHYGHEVMAGSDLWFTKQYQDRFAHLLEMAEWKNKQFQEEKKQLIEKDCKEHCNCCGYAYMACRRYNYDNLHCRHYINFKQAIEEKI